MNPFNRLKRLHQEVFVRGQATVAQEKAARDLTDNLSVLQEAAKVAAETMDLADQLAADSDPHKKRLAALIKDYAEEGIKQVFTGQLPAEEGRAIDPEDPFSVESERSRASLPGSPDSTTVKALPQTPAAQPTAKRGRGRPRKNPQQL